MTEVIFITGATGFVGKHLFSRLAESGRWLIRVLVRRPVEQETSPVHTSSYVVGDLCTAATYREALKDVDTVIHLAAVTGKAAPRDYERTNVEGTKVLLEACKETGVKRIIFVSTIATTYLDKRYYSYARSKAQAEALLRTSGIPAVIIRPTIVLVADHQFGSHSRNLPNYQLSRCPMEDALNFNRSMLMTW